MYGKKKTHSFASCQNRIEKYSENQNLTMFTDNDPESTHETYEIKLMKIKIIIYI